MTLLSPVVAGVVVIDDQPEVSIDDPAFLFENNEGFHEVLSKKMMKSKQKAAAAVEESEKKAEQQSKKRDSTREKVTLNGTGS